MEVNGKVVHKLTKETGTSKAGTDWQKQVFVVETDGQYPKKIAITAFGKAVEYSEKLKAGDMVKVQLDLDSREYEGKWYTNINAWRIEVEGAQHQQAAPPPAVNAPEVPNDDLLF